MSKTALVRSIDELNRARPERFACPECAMPTTIDLDNFVRPHGPSPQACAAVGHRVAVRWRENGLRCPSCRATTTMDERARAETHEYRGKTCGGSGQRGIQWRILQFGDGSVNMDEPDRDGGRQRFEKFEEPPARRVEGAGSRARTRTPSSGKEQKRTREKRQERQRTENAKVVNASPEQISKYVALGADERARERLRVAEQLKAQRQGPVFVRLVSGGLPGSSRRH